MSIAFGNLHQGERRLLAYKRPASLRGAARRQADALVDKFDAWHAQNIDGWADCFHIATVVGEALQRLGHDVEVIVGVAYASDSKEVGIHSWLHVDGKFYDPKHVLLRRDDKSFSYSRYDGDAAMTVKEALNNSVEECPVLE